MQTAESILMNLFPGDSPEQSALRQQIKPVSLPAGQNVFQRGDACENYLVLVSGSVKVQVLSAGGREVVLYHVKDGESCVITTSCLISHEAYPAEGITEIDTLALVIPRPVFEEGLAHSPVFRKFVFSNQGRRLGDLIQRVEDIAFGRLDERLARFLSERSEQGGKAVTATHQELASELGTAREVVSRQLKVFERNGWIETRRGSVAVVDIDALNEVWRHS